MRIYRRFYPLTSIVRFYFEISTLKSRFFQLFASFFDFSPQNRSFCFLLNLSI